MQNDGNPRQWPNFRFNAEEIAGAVGDYGTLIPIVLGVAIVSNVNLGHILLFFSIWYILTGLYYKMPVPVEPMKVIGAIVIAESLTAGEIAASGMILGVLFLALGFFKGMKFIRDKVPSNVIRGIQLGLALILIETSFDFISGDYLLASISIVIIILFLIASRVGKIPDVSAIAVLIMGVIVGLLAFGIPRISILPLPDVVVPTAQDFLKGGWSLAVPQIPLSITNAILATTLLMQDLVHRDVDPDNVRHTLLLLNDKPIERLRRALQRGRRVNIR